jgi:hypothetical protein
MGSSNLYHRQLESCQSGTPSMTCSRFHNPMVAVHLGRIPNIFHSLLGRNIDQAKHTTKILPQGTKSQIFQTKTWGGHWQLLPFNNLAFLPKRHLMNCGLWTLFHPISLGNFPNQNLELSQFLQAPITPTKLCHYIKLLLSKSNLVS